MAKTNFTKVEEALRDGLDKMIKEKLLEEADAAQGKIPFKQHALDELVAKIRHEFHFLRKQDPDLLTKMGLDEKVLKELLSSSNTLSKKDIQDILHKIEAYRQDLEKKNPKATDEQLIEVQKKKHITKRFNIRDDWLPLQ